MRSDELRRAPMATEAFDSCQMACAWVKDALRSGEPRVTLSMLESMRPTGYARELSLSQQP